MTLTAGAPGDRDDVRARADETRPGCERPGVRDRYVHGPSQDSAARGASPWSLTATLTAPLRAAATAAYSSTVPVVLTATFHRTGERLLDRQAASYRYGDIDVARERV